MTYLTYLLFVIDDSPVIYSPVVGGEYYNTAGTVPYTQYQTAAYPADPAWTMRYTNPTGILNTPYYYQTPVSGRNEPNTTVAASASPSKS